MGSRGSKASGYVFAIAGVGTTLAILIAGACVIAAVGKPVPTELWAIGGTLTGALAGILTPPPRSSKGLNDEEIKKMLAAGVATGKSKAENAELSGEATICGANAAERAIKARLNELKAEVERGDLASGLPSHAASSIATKIAAIEPIPGSDGPRRKAERAIQEATTSKAHNIAATYAVENEQVDPAAAKSAAEAVITGSLQEGEAQVSGQNEIGKRTISTAREVRQEVNDAARNASEQFATETATPRTPSVVLKASFATLGMSRARAMASTAEVSPAVGKASADTAAAIHNAATEGAEAAAPTQADSASPGFWDTVGEAKVLIPLVLLLVTLLLGLLLGIGVIHAPSKCAITEMPKEGSACSTYVSFASSAATVLISLAGATIGALVGVFVGHPPETPSKPSGA